MATTPKANLLDHFYDHLDEDDWFEGLDLYQSGNVGNLQVFDGLITGHVSPLGSLRAEVRLKIHPAGHCIQWIECTCRKNRTTGQYCEHIAAFMIHVDRERKELVARLDTAMPLKPPATPRKKSNSTSTVPGAETEKSQGKNATHTIIEHLKGHIQSVALHGGGPGLRVKIEIKTGSLTNYDLNLDLSAKFLTNHPTLEAASSEVQLLKVYEELEVELGTRIYQPEPEKIIAERVITLRNPKRLFSSPSEHDLKIPGEIDQYRRLGPDRIEGDDDEFLIVPLKSSSKYLGDEFYFFPGKGYLKLNKKFLTSVWHELPLAKTYKDDDAALFVKEQFRDYAFASPIFLDSSLKDAAILEAPELSEIEILSEQDGWFRLDPRYGKGKASISMVELMLQYRKKRRKYVRSGDQWMKIPEFITEHDWQIDESGNTLKVDALGLLRLKAAIGEFDRFVGSKRALENIKATLEFQADMTAPTFHNANVTLRGYQDVGLRWLWWLYRNGLHGLLADEMGLGKTHQAMALLLAIQHEKPDARFLVICPTTVLDHWLDKLEQFAPNLKPLKYHGSKRTAGLSLLDRERVTLLTSYGIVLRDIRHLGLRKWDAVILDEAHMIKNSDTATYQAVCKLNSRIRICLTGTPIENHLGELKNLFDFLVPGYLGSDEYFRKNFISRIEGGKAPETELALQKLIHPFKLRRTKENVLPELPAKIEDIRNCTLSAAQVKLYREVISLKAAPLVQQMQDDKNPIPFLHVFATLTLLKQICDHPALLDDHPDYKRYESGKFELLKELLEEALGSGHKVVIFSQYVTMIKLITHYLSDQGIGYVELTGQTRDRGEVIKRFQTKPELKVFCGSLLAGGIGIDLTAASVVIHYDRWWNASKENQATDRVHRIGQNKNVQVLKLVTRGTLEEKIDRMIASKRALFEKFMDRDEEIFKTLSRTELIELLQ